MKKFKNFDNIVKSFFNVQNGFFIEKEEDYNEIYKKLVENKKLQIIEINTAGTIEAKYKKHCITLTKHGAFIE